MKKSYIVGKFISLNEGLPVWYRVFFSAIILSLILKLFKIRTTASIKDKLQIAKIGVFITVHWVFFYASIKYFNISVGAVCYCLTSFFTAAFGPIINRHRIHIAEIAISVLTLIGIILSAFAALYTIYNERLVRKYDSRIINYYQMIGGTLVLGLFLPVYLHFFPANSLFPTFKDTDYLLLLASFCTVGLYVLFAESLKRISAFTVNLSFNLEPVYAIILAFLFFHESKQLNLSFYIGLLFVMASVILQSILSIRSTHKTHHN